MQQSSCLPLIESEAMSTQRAVKNATMEVETVNRLTSKVSLIASSDLSHPRAVSVPAGISSKPLESVGKPLREDPAFDRQIIEGMLENREAFLKKMQTEGFDEKDVVRRSMELGLSDALIRQVKGVAADLAGERPGRGLAPSSLGARTCLSCDRVFLSNGPGNRLCMRCRGGDAGLARL